MTELFDILLPMETGPVLPGSENGQLQLPPQITKSCKVMVRNCDLWPPINLLLPLLVQVTGYLKNEL